MKIFNKILAAFTIFSSAVSIIVILNNLTQSPVEQKYQILLCILAAVLVIIPFIISKIFKITIPEFIKTFLFSYIIGGILLGNIYNFYYIVPFWDKVLHLLSGVLFVFASFILINIFTEKGYIKLNKVSAIIIAFIFTLAMGVIWEFIEYAADGLLNVNMQRYRSVDGVPYIGRQSLVDTMDDMLYAAAGAAVACIIAAFKKDKKAIKTEENIQQEEISD